MDNQKAISKLVSTVLSYVQRSIDKASFDRTFRARIVKIISDEKYQVEWKGAHYTVRGFQSYSIGDLVYVCAPTNQWEDLFILPEKLIVENNTPVWEKIYPIGTIYMSVNDTSPEKLFGGKWVSWGSGRVPVGVNTSDGNFNSVEKTGGASTHAHTNPVTGWTTLTVDQIPAHKHGSENWNWEVSGGFNTGNYDVTGVSTNRGNAYAQSSIYTGGGQGHNHSMGDTGSTSTLQPYITCYMWKRTA